MLVVLLVAFWAASSNGIRRFTFAGIALWWSISVAQPGRLLLCVWPFLTAPALTMSWFGIFLNMMHEQWHPHSSHVSLFSVDALRHCRSVVWWNFRGCLQTTVPFFRIFQCCALSERSARGQWRACNGKSLPHPLTSEATLLHLEYRKTQVTNSVKKGPVLSIFLLFSVNWQSQE